MTEKWVPFERQEERELIGAGCEIDGDEAEFPFDEEQLLLTIRKIEVGRKTYVYHLALLDITRDLDVYTMGTYAYMSFKSLIEDLKEPYNDDRTFKFAKESTDEKETKETTSRPRKKDDQARKRNRRSKRGV